MEVLLIYYEPQPSGQTSHVISLARGLDRGRFHVTVVLPDHLHGPAADLARIGVEVAPLPLRKLEWNPQTMLALGRLIRRSGADIVHVHSQEAGLWARVVARLAAAPAILYTPQVVDIRSSRWHWLYVLVERLLANLTKLIISVNESDRERLRQWGIPPSKLAVVPNGINLTEFVDQDNHDELATILGWDGQRPLVMQVGRLSEQKNPIAFVEGAARVVHRCPNVQFAMVGDGPLREDVEARVRELGLDRSVRVLGWIDRASRLMAVADIVTLTSRWEGTPFALLEAMAWSRPVVATAVNGCPEIVADGVSGYLVPVGDTAAWAEAVADLLNDRANATAMGLRGRRRVEAHYGLEQMIARIESLYVQVGGQAHWYDDCPQERLP